MQNLQEWSFCREEEITVFPNLLRLTVEDCPRLKSLPGGLKGSPLKELVIDICPILERISHLPALRELSISGECPLLKDVEKLDSLERLTIYPPGMDFLAEGLLRLLQDRQLHQDDDFTLVLHSQSDVLFSKCVMGGEYWPVIQNLPRVEADWGYLNLRYTKEPYHYETS
ncbi:uncharacterized protein LOC109836618 [Asparagus officinalis]|uniref:uncharacterized protein LOC109836618 n=1 Tax=Asparagus officinalis TaxID=4686 RepID=UPI00098E7264|nr:uncharacterized protein LOC109836618 [Asparagus officinalis]